MSRKPIPLKNIRIDDAFWNGYMQLVREKVLPYQWEALNDRIPEAAKSHCIKNFEIAAQEREGEFYGMVFQDSDLYKWLESAAYSLETKPDAELERLADGAIRLIAAAQRPDGYVNTYFTVKEPARRWTNLREGHELYCAGHLIEAAVAYYDATGKRALLDVAIRFADCVDREFGCGEGQRRGYPGHQEIELALVKLYETTGERRYLDLAAYFISERGGTPNYFDLEFNRPEFKPIFAEFGQFFHFDRDWRYSQSHMPPAEQRQAAGHAVRAAYMYSAMADLAAHTGDKALLEACDALYEDIITRQMYVTGATGAASQGERFTGAYNLPNDLVYGETCAAVGLMMFCRRMNALRPDAMYADTMELALYNTVLAGISLSGTEFFYVNPLESDPAAHAVHPALRHVKPVRQKWFDCSCCPTNITRTVMSVGAYAYACDESGVTVNLYLGSTVEHGGRTLTVETAYPYGDRAVIRAGGGRYTLSLRSPSHAPIVSLAVNGEEETPVTRNGYIELTRDWNGDVVSIGFGIKPRLIYSSLRVQNNAGKAAVMRGPLVYCAEEADNGALLAGYVMPEDVLFRERSAPDGLPPAAVALEAAAFRYKGGDALYSQSPPALEPARLTMIPYFLWANRGENEMRCYLNVAAPLPDRR